MVLESTWCLGQHGAWGKPSGHLGNDGESGGVDVGEREEAKNVHDEVYQRRHHHGAPVAQLWVWVRVWVRLRAPPPKHTSSRNHTTMRGHAHTRSLRASARIHAHTQRPRSADAHQEHVFGHGRARRDIRRLIRNHYLHTEWRRMSLDARMARAGKQWLARPARPRG